MKRTLWLRHVAMLSALALALAACGDNGDDPDDDDDPDVEAPDVDEDDDAEEDPDADDPDAEDPADEDEDADADEEAVDIDRPERDDVLNLGYLLPETGDLATLGVPQITAIQMAVDDINAAGGVLGSDVTLESGDEAGEGPVAREETARLINAGVDAIVGAAASGMSQEVIDLTHDNQIVQCSASNTSPAFTDQDNNAFYFRTVPPDEAVSPIIANEVIGDGYTNVAVLARADDYGNALRELVVDALGESVEVVVDEGYNPDIDDFSSLVNDVVSSGADSAVVIGFGESAPLFAQLIEGGIPADAMYGGDGVFGPNLADNIGTDVEGLKVIGAAGGQEFNDRLNERLDDANQGNLIYGGQAYDCAIIVALAAEITQSADPAVFNEAIGDVTTGGEDCDSFEACKALIEDGQDINYSGASGPIELDRPDPTQGRYAVGQFTADGLEIVGEQDVDVTSLD
jgi:ABC-type branched-subunit amino acid transport system substrate-binding protein